jgi:hypothetical protein
MKCGELSSKETSKKTMIIGVVSLISQLARPFAGLLVPKHYALRSFVESPGA